MPRLILILLAAALPVCPQQPALFAGGMVPAAGPTGITFSPDGKTVYFVQLHQNIMFSRLEDGRWSEPRPMPFSGPWRDGDPFVSPDGKRLFFWSNRPLEGRQRKGNAIWVCERKPSGWSEPHDIGIAVNGPEGGAAFASVAANGALYFFASRADSFGGPDLYRAAPGAPPENLGPAINSKSAEFDPYVAPDESYIVFASDRPGGFGQADLYISERKDGNWTQPRNLGPRINSGASECCPAVSPDGRYFYFTSQGGRSGIYRIGIAALGLRPSRPYEDAQLFEAGVISTPGAFSIAFSPDGREAYFAEVAASIVVSRVENGRWTAPAALPFCGRYLDTAPALSPDGKRLFFQSSRPHPGKGGYLSIWTAERTDRGWSAPAPLEPSINGLAGAASPSQAANGALYFTASGDIYRAKRTPQGYGEPEKLEPPVNSAAGEGEVCIAPDESYLVFTSDRPGGSGGRDLFVSELKNGAWTEPRNLGPQINTPAAECCPAVSPDGRRLYFMRLGGDKPGIYEVEFRTSRR
jgi:Tol biopolymer transport system component